MIIEKFIKDVAVYLNECRQFNLNIKIVEKCAKSLAPLVVKI